MTTEQSASVRAASLRERRVWLLERLAAGRGISAVTVAARVDATLDPVVAQAAFGAVLAERPELCTVVHGDLADPRITLRPGPYPVAVHHQELHDSDLPAVLADLASRRSSTDEAPVRLHLLPQAGGTVVCLVLHQLAADTVDPVQLMAELSAAYGGARAARHRGPGLPPSRPLADASPASVKYWTNELAGCQPERLPMATAKPAPAAPTGAGQRVHAKLSARALTGLATLGTRYHTCEPVVLLTAYLALLAQHGSGPDIVVGVAAPAAERQPDGSAGRDRCPGHRDDGHPARTLPIRVFVDPDASFDELLRRTSTSYHAALRHADATFEDLPHGAAPNSRTWWAPLHRHALHPHRPAPQPWPLRFEGREARLLDSPPGTASLDLRLRVRFDQTGVALVADFNPDVHDRHDITAFLARLDRLLADPAPTQPVGQARLTAADQTLIDTANDTACAVPVRSVAEAIVEQARRAPHRPAVDGTTYRELVERAGAVRARLVAAGLGSGDVVGVAGPRGADLAAAMLGVWGAGAAYLPIGAGLPPSRIRQQVTDVAAKVILRAGATELPDVPGADFLDLDLEATGEPGGAWDTGQAAYVLFTSGSTGQPKGVTVPHSALSNLVFDMARRLSLAANTRVLWSTSITFDVSALEVFTPLVAGAQVRTAPEHAVLTPRTFAELIEELEVDVVQGTPTLWQHLLPALERTLSRCRVLVGGEQLTPALANRLVEVAGAVYNVYGPTETTIWSTVAPLAAPLPEQIPIGLPIANTRVYVLDSQGRQVFPGLPGELCIAGAGLAVGYLGAETRTAERFVQHPRLGRYYRTGDRARQRTDGVLEFLGRGDRQVKIRGHRIEPAEVETVLNSHPEVSAAAVVTETDPAGRLRLAAAVRLTQDRDGLVPELRDRVASRLPVAAVPTRIAVLPAMPTTVNGKLDYEAVRQAIAAAHEPRAGTQATTADEGLVRSLIELWCEELDEPSLSTESDFFQHGGQVWQAALMSSRISRIVGHPVPLTAVFQASTPAEMAAFLGGGGFP